MEVEVWGGDDSGEKRDSQDKELRVTQLLPSTRVGGWSASTVHGCAEPAGHRQPAPRRGPFSSRSSPPAHRLAPLRRLTVPRNWLSSSQPSPTSDMTPEAPALLQAPAPLLLPAAGGRPLTAAAALSFLLLFLLFQRSAQPQQRGANSQPHRELGYLHCRAPTPTKQPAYLLNSGASQVHGGRGPREESSAPARAQPAGRRGESGRGRVDCITPHRAAHSAEMPTPLQVRVLPSLF